MKAPKGGHRRLPHFGKADEEGKNTKGMNPRQEIVPRLPSGVAECGKHKQRKVGGLEAPQSSLERLEAPKSRPGGFKIEPGALQDAIFEDIYFKKVLKTTPRPYPDQIFFDF